MTGSRPALRSGGRGGRVLALAAVALVVGAAGFWAGRATLRDEALPEQLPDSFVDVEVSTQEIGRVLTLSATVRRVATPLATNALAGVVTQVSEDGAFSPGDVLYTVGDTPVVAVEGTTPFWRELGLGAAGDDVRQVQAYLTAGGWQVAVDGRWGERTTAAVRVWQRDRGVAQSGTIALGTMVAIPPGSAAVDLDENQLWEGAALDGGEEVISVAAGAPTFVMELTTSQAALIPTGTTATVHGPDADWVGVTGDVTQTENGAEIPITAADGSALCGGPCGGLPATADLRLLTAVAVSPPVRGPVVPLAAVSTGPDRATTVDVVQSDGAASVRSVTVLAVADGLAVVDGVDAGERVRVFGEGATEPVASPVDPGTERD